MAQENEQGSILLKLGKAYSPTYAAKAYNRVLFMLLHRYLCGCIKNLCLCVYPLTEWESYLLLIEIPLDFLQPHNLILRTFELLRPLGIDIVQDFVTGSKEFLNTVIVRKVKPKSPVAVDRILEGNDLGQLKVVAVCAEGGVNEICCSLIKEVIYLLYKGL